jgi:hypothetical protein
VKLNPTITISLCLNLALAGAAVHLLKHSDSLRPRGSAAANAETTGPAVVSRLVASNPPVSIAYITNRFAWSAVEVEDFEQLAMNLRAIGCPGKTVRDVVVARARRGLDRHSRRAEFKLSFWAAGLRRADAQREAELQAAAARAKMLANVERVVGRNVFTADERLTQDFVEQAIVRFLSGPMSEEKFSQLAGLLVRQKAQRDEVRAKAHGVLLAEDEALLKKLGREFHQELAEVLLPAELEEFTARVGMMKLADQVQFEATDLSLAEIRAVALIRGRFDDPVMEEWFEGDSLTDEQAAQLTKAGRELLGESRYAQVERAADGDFKRLFDLGRAHDLPRAAVMAAFELRQLTTQEVVRLREDKSLSDAERQQQLAMVQTQAQEEVLKVLGADACIQYLSRGGSWLTNLSGL